jgi:dolichyl-phosphate-mannose-protein mannosyltransferase
MSDSDSDRERQDTPTRLPRLQLVLLAALTLLALALRLYRIHMPDLTGDEELGTNLIAMSYADVFLNYAQRPPLPLVFQKLCVDLFNSYRPFVLRLPSVIEGALAIPLLFAFAARAWDRRRAWIIALLLALSHFHTLWSRDARYYPMYLLTAVLYLMAYWEFFQKRRLKAFPFLLLAALAVAWSHQAGPLFLLASAAAAAPFLLRKPWRDLARSNRRLLLSGGAAAVVGIAVSLALMRPYAQGAINVLQASAERETRTPFFDISPGFLINRLDMVSGVPMPYTLGVFLLMITGLVWVFRNQRAFGVLCLCTFLNPFALVWMLKPEHWWHPKYFMFMQPFVLILVGLGIAALADALTRRRGEAARSTAAGYAVICLLVVAVSTPNLHRVVEMYRRPDMTMQRTGHLLAQWLRPDDEVRFTIDHHARLLRHYMPGEQQRALWDTFDETDLAEWSPGRAQNTWFVHLGKGHVHQDVADLLLSNRFSRLAFNELILAHGPNPQRIAFDEVESFTVGPEQEASLSVLFPLEGRHAVFVHPQPAASIPAAIGLQLGDGDTVTLPAFAAQPPGYYYGEIDVPWGLQALTLENAVAEVGLSVQSIEIIPMLVDVVNFPGWAFYGLEGSQLERVWTEQDGSRLYLRHLGDAWAYYRFFSPGPGQAAFRLAVRNDAPGTNRWTLYVPGAINEPLFLLPSRSGNDKDVVLETAPVTLQRGVYTICVQYQPLPAEEAAANTADFTILTPERVQSAYLERVEVISAGTAE